MTAKYQADAPVNKKYQLIKLAWNNYQSAPENLELESLNILQKQVEVVQRLMTAVLSSPEAKNEWVKEQEVVFVFEQLQQQFDSIESFALSLKQQELSEQQLQEAIYQDLLCEKTIAANGQDYTAATEQEALEYYQKNKERFLQPERRKVSHILITINDEYAENTRTQALKKIEKLSKRLKHHITEFSNLALQHSECPTALNNGLIGVVTRGQLYPELDALLFNMQANRVSSVVESDNGFHLLLCHKILPAGEISQADAIKDIRKQLDQHRQKKCEKKWLSSLLEAV